MGKKDSESDGMQPLPCPFCGGRAVAMHMDYGHGYLPKVQTVCGVFCRSDLNAEYQHGHYIDNYATEEDAVHAWNRITR